MQGIIITHNTIYHVDPFVTHGWDIVVRPSCPCVVKSIRSSKIESNKRKKRVEERICVVRYETIRYDTVQLHPRIASTTIGQHGTCGSSRSIHPSLPPSLPPFGLAEADLFHPVKNDQQEEQGAVQFFRRATASSSGSPDSSVGRTILHS
mmetsp:Transcript_3995/g.11404  ORF Transcript_3995/g.11404 Transcript_3995/m.11404 type:complete len:150 (+) Transcript_3995:1849-2298(+)